MTTVTAWSDRVVVGEVNGHACRLYAERVGSITAVLDQADRWSDRTYLVQGESSVTFDEHRRTSLRMAACLRDAGVKPGDRVCLFASNSPEWVSAFFAILGIGGIVVACNGWWTEAEMRHACKEVTPTVVIADERRAGRVPDDVHVFLLRDLAATEASAVPTDLTTPPADENAPAIILFTAGTTGFPKGVVLSHRAVVSNLQTLLVVSRKLPHQIEDDAAASVTLVGLPLFHMGAIQLVLTAHMTGSRIVFLGGRFDPGAVLRSIEEQEVTMFSGVPTMMQRVLSHPDIATRRTDSLRTVVLGGSPVSPELLERVHDAFPNARRRIGQTYGLTEAGGVVSTGVGADMLNHPGSSGRVAPVVEVVIDAPGADGTGEILVRSPAAMDGYWGMSADGAITPDGWLRTGDIGRLDEDGFLYVTGRSKEVIIRGGENVSALYVEEVLLGHPTVAEVAVVGLADVDLGEAVGAAVVSADGPPISVTDLETWARERLAHFEVPSRWWIRTSHLPVNDAGKVLKAGLVAEWPSSDR